MLAVIKTGGKQYIVKENDKLKVEKLEGNVGDTIKLEEVLLADEKIGSPLLPGAYVEAKIVRQDKDKKIRVVKFKSKVRYLRTRGHRQPFTELQITKISA
ncbi:MAG: 50S ribosomal protein L21 [Patescibacteria group bacterium]